MIPVPQPPAIVEIFGQPITLARVVSAMVILVVSFVLAVVLRRLISRYSLRQDQSRRATWYTVSRIASYTILAVGAVVAISALGIPMGKLAVLAGGLGVGLGFGLQAIFSNFISGLILLFDKSVKVGDFVELASGVTGEVRDIKSARPAS